MSCEPSFLPESFNVFLPAVSGDTYPEGILFEEDGIDETLTRVTVDFKLDPSQATEDLQLDSDDDTITLSATGANAWAFLVPSFQVNLAAGDYYYHIRAFFGTDHKRTLLSGVFTVQESI